MASGVCIIFRKAFSSLSYFYMSVYIYASYMYIHLFILFILTFNIDIYFVLWFRPLAYIYCKEYSSHIASLHLSSIAYQKSMQAAQIFVELIGHQCGEWVGSMHIGHEWGQTNQFGL